MSDYFDSSSNRVSAGSLAQSSQVNAVRDEVGVGFDKLPTPSQISAGMVSFATDTGSANAYAIALPKTQSSYTKGLMVRFDPANTNTAASTLNVDSLGVKSIKRPNGTDVQAGDIVAGQVVELTYNGANFVFTGSFPVSMVTEASSYTDLAKEWATNAYDDPPETGKASAKAWATTAEDQAVAGGEYSAYHWAQKASSTVVAHKDSHDPNDGSDALDTANAAEIAGVQAAGTGTSHSFARADHIHAINHGIADNHLVTIDSSSVADNDYAKFTVNGLEGKSYAEVRSDLNVEDGATADQTNTEIRTAVGAAADSNVFTDALLSKLNGVEASADVTDATNVNAAGAVMNTGNESIAGVKTFTSFPITPSSGPSSDYQTANKKYVDDHDFVFATTSLSGTSGALTATQCNGFTTFINSGVVTRILPTAAVGLRVSFLSTSTDSFKIYANTGDLISYNGNNTTSGGYIHSDIEGTYFELICTSTSEWRISVLNDSIKYDE